MTTKITDMRTAISAHVHDGDCVVIEGFTACICFAAAHEIIRQGRRELTLCRMTPDLVYDQMIAAGCARKLVCSHLDNPGVGSLHCVRRAVECGVPRALELEEYSHFGMVGRYMAGAVRLPFCLVRSYRGTGQLKVKPRIKFVPNPYDGVASEFTHVDSVAMVPPPNPDVAILHAQRADAAGNTQMWGLLGAQKEVAFAAERVIVVVEEIVDSAVIRSDPNRAMVPGLVVDALVQQPYAVHPSYAQGYYDRDNQFYLQWDAISRDEDATRVWLREWVYGVDDWEDYLAKMESEQPDIWERLAPEEALAQSVNCGAYALA
ncbi:MAG TPA: CoA-transferase [Anaerolineales bacterium]|jgi:glutaconate CoA-transferase subunit A|nr:CoA-transferase [Anaerolineales bacterium]